MTAWTYYAPWGGMIADLGAYLGGSASPDFPPTVFPEGLSELDWISATPVSGHPGSGGGAYRQRDGDAEYNDKFGSTAPVGAHFFVVAYNLDFTAFTPGFTPESVAPPAYATGGTAPDPPPVPTTGLTVDDPIVLPSTASGYEMLEIRRLPDGEAWLKWVAPADGSMRIEFGSSTGRFTAGRVYWFETTVPSPTSLDDLIGYIAYCSDDDDDGITTSDIATADTAGGAFGVYAGRTYMAQIQESQTSIDLVPVRWVLRTEVATTGTWLSVELTDEVVPGWAPWVNASVDDGHIVPFFDGYPPTTPDNGVRIYPDGDVMAEHSYNNTGHSVYDAEDTIDFYDDPNAAAPTSVLAPPYPYLPTMGGSIDDLTSFIGQQWLAGLSTLSHTSGGYVGLLQYISTVFANRLRMPSWAPAYVWSEAGISSSTLLIGRVEYENGFAGSQAPPLSTKLCFAGDLGQYADAWDGVYDAGLSTNIRVLDATAAYPDLVPDGAGTLAEWLTPTDLAALPAIATVAIDDSDVDVSTSTHVEVTTTKEVASGEWLVLVLASDWQRTGTPLPDLDRFDGTDGGQIRSGGEFVNLAFSVLRTFPRVRALTYVDRPLPEGPSTGIPALRQYQRDDGLTGGVRSQFQATSRQASLRQTSRSTYL